MFSFFKRKKRPVETPQEALQDTSAEASQSPETEVIPRKTSEQPEQVIASEASTETVKQTIEECAQETTIEENTESAPPTSPTSTDTSDQPDQPQETIETKQVNEIVEEVAEEIHEPEAKEKVETSSPADESVAQSSTVAPETPEDVSVETPVTPLIPEETSADNAKKSKKKGFFSRLKASLSKTRKSFTENLASLFLGKKEIDEDLLDELEMVLLTADMGVDTTDRIIQNLTDQVSRKELKDPEALYESLKIQLRDILHPIEAPLTLQPKSPTVILVVGVNGAGKTTTIGKLAHQFQKEGKSVMLAAGDTFRAAAVEQLQTWGERNQVPVIAQKTGADSAAVIFDAVQSAQAKGIDVLIADTAGRLHTQSNLMEELKKVKRVISKVMPDAPHEVMLVLDAGTGQNALSQAKLFNEAVGLTGLTLTKLDGTAKGGVIFALANQLQVPVRYIGVGEGIEDLRPFHANDFIEALFDTRNT